MTKLTMHILLLAPHPFFQERGTPIAVDLLIQALVKRGDRVTLLTYHEGEDRDYGPTVTMHRIKAPRFIRHIRPGFSLKKLICDMVMMPHAMRLASTLRVDCIHAVEESAFMARRISRRLGIPYIFDMDSSMPRQIADKVPILGPLVPLMRWIERRAMRDAIAVVPMCDSIADEARQAGARHVTLLRDISLVPMNVAPDPALGFRRATGITGPVVLYIGNLEPYQGIDLLLQSVAQVLAGGRALAVVIAGGRADDIATCRARATALGIADRVYFLGPRPVAHMPHLFHEADMLISPRTQGQNTPMKIYSYLDAGKPLVATRLPTHTQVLDDQVALLADPTPDGMASAMVRLLDDPALGAALAAAAVQRARQYYSLPAFERSVNSLYDTVAVTLGSTGRK
ncbi:MAG TPA: glycosyltransferase [Verrucomicrobia bacterium]|nr:glycosyltransferase [Verrucomicrobiota bacterium]